MESLLGNASGETICSQLLLHSPLSTLHFRTSSATVWAWVGVEGCGVRRVGRRSGKAGLLARWRASTIRLLSIRITGCGESNVPTKARSDSGKRSQSSEQSCRWIEPLETCHKRAKLCSVRVIVVEGCLALAQVS